MTTHFSGLLRHSLVFLLGRLTPLTKNIAIFSLPLETNKLLPNSYESNDGILYLTFPFLFMGLLVLDQLAMLEIPVLLVGTEREVTHGSYEVFPFTLGTQETLIKVDEEMLYCWI